MSSDPTTWGPQPNGFVTPTQQDIIDSIKSDQTTYIATNYDNSDGSPEGTNVGIFSRQLALGWEALRALSVSRSRDGAEGDALVQHGVLTGTPDQGPTTTKVTCSCGLAIGTVLQAGVSMVSITGRPTDLFTPTVDFTAPSTGPHSVPFECLETGPVTCPAGGLVEIRTPITGWTSCTNPLDGVPGTNGYTDDQFRAQQVLDLTRAGSSTARAIAVDIESIDGVLHCDVLENYTDTYDANGVPPHAIEPVIYLDGTEVEAVLAEGIWNAKPAGCATAGSTEISFVDSLDGETRYVRYTPVTQRPVYLSYTLTTGSGYVGASAVKDYVVQQMTARGGVGVDVVALVARSQPLNLTGVLDVPTFTLGYSPAPSGVANLTVGPREIALFDQARVVIS